MRFVIVGYGRVGSRTATILDEEGHDVAVVDNDIDRLKRVSDGEFETVHGRECVGGRKEAAVPPSRLALPAARTHQPI